MADGDAVVSIRERLLRERTALLDLSTRNRLLNTPLRTKNNRAIEIVDEKAAEVFRLLTSNKALSFVPGVQATDNDGAEGDDDFAAAPPRQEEDTYDERGGAARHADTRLQTRLTPEGLQKRLFDVWYDAQTLEQEQGVNILYLAIGLLRWFDSDASDIPRHAPLVLLPVKLERSSAADRFRLRWRDEPPSPNLTLQAKMKAEFSLTIDDFSDEDEVDLPGYCARIAETVSGDKRWEVLPDAMVLGFFSFSKFLMYRDLDPDNWPQGAGIDTREMIAALLRDGFPESSGLVAEEDTIDEIIRPLELHHVVDADSSQTIVIAEAAAGRSLVVKGPPGTGKSQTITNIIAAAVARGKKVLFVAEKLAALDVVHRRLRQVGLGPLALELHSNKANKRALLEELKRTRDAQLKPLRGDPSVVEQLGEATDALNAFAGRLHRPLAPSGLTPHAILGFMARMQESEAPTGYALVGAEAWDQEAVAVRRAGLTEAAARARALGPAPANVWRGVRRDAIDPVERQAFSDRLRSLKEAKREAETIAPAAQDLLAGPRLVTVRDLQQSMALLSLSPLPEALDRSTLTDPAWSRLDDLQRLVEAGRTYVAAWTDAAAAFNEPGQAADLSSIRTAIVTKGSGIFRFLDAGYRRQIALLRSYVTAPLPTTAAERTALVDRMISAQNARSVFKAIEATGETFGAAWRGDRSDWDRLDAILAWRRRHADAPADAWARLSSTPGLARIEAARVALATALRRFESALGGIVDELDLDLRRAFGVAAAEDVSLAELSLRIEAWLGDLEGLSTFITFATKTRALAGLGLASLADGLHDGALDHATLVPAFDRAYAETLRVALFSAWPDLRAFDGESHDHQVALFRRLDRLRIGLAQEQIVAAHAENRPGGAGGIGPLGVLNAEMARKRGHLPIRALLDKAGPAVQQLKPVFMMSPLSVAQFLKPGGLQFDLLVMDEASQIEPVDSLGAVARVDQVIVVGDERQLPPTAFFKKLTGEDDLEEVDDGVTIQAKDAESILELCLAKGMPHRMLSWHYRSKHQSLIAVSNREFYENKLFVVPSPYDAVAGMGLKFHELRDTAYDRGGTRTNPKEARAVAEAVIRHARTTPDQTLGVATFSVAQRQAVLKELELLRRANPDVEDFFGAAASEPFFVKNLENIQGDERDVIFISVGYGKTETGYLAHAFGPLSGEGGERRLNVLISRAKLRCEVFCNFTGADIDLERTGARGVAALKLFLTFAETGDFGLGEVSGEDFDSAFEMQLCERLQALGHDVKRQIGASGFRVDLAVCDPDKPGRFLLGIECDGAQFHSSRSARDRDRLRQQVLEAHGWIIHRIWSADWYLRPQAELKKIENAIAAARAAWRARDEGGYEPAQAPPPPLEAEAVDGEPEGATPVEQTTAPSPARTAYVEADFPVNRAVEPHQTPVTEMAGYVARIVEVEGPIHIDEIVARLRILWGLARAGARIRAAVERAAETAKQGGLIEGDGFYQSPGRPVVGRDRSRVGSSTLRRPEALPPAEIDQVLVAIVGANFGAGRDDLIQTAARTFGFASTSAQLRAVMTDRIDRLVTTGRLADKGGLLIVTKP